MSFINKSVNYSQTVLLKSHILKPILDNYNAHLSALKKNQFVSVEDSIYIPNNNKKFHCLVTPKNNIDKNCKEKFAIAYFFSNNTHCEDFYVEMDDVLEDTILFEGYLYQIERYDNFLVTDILFSSALGGVVDYDYACRYTLLNEKLFYKLHLLKCINNKITLGIHPIFSQHSENMIEIFKNNFIYNESINSLEKVINFQKSNYVTCDEKQCEENKIVRTPLSEVYNVYDVNSNKFKGILYVKGLRESRALNELTNNADTIIIQCEFNKRFNKWQPTTESLKLNG